MDRKRLILLIVAIILIASACRNRKESSLSESSETGETVQEVVAPTPEAQEDEKSSETVEEQETIETPEAVMDEEALITQIEKSIFLGLGPRDKILDISLDNREILINLQLERTDTVLSRFTGVTKQILKIEEGYDLWESVTIDFGSQGHITKNKEDAIVENGEKIFEVETSDIIKEQ